MTAGSQSIVTFGRLCDLIAVQRNPGDVPDAKYLGLEHLAPGRMRAVKEGRATDVQSQKFAFRRDDVLYGKLRPYLDKAVLAKCDGVCTTELLVLRARSGIDPRYLACIVHAPDFVNHAMSGVTGAHHPRTSWSHIAHFELPRHDDQEQAAIAALLWGIHDLLIASEASAGIATELKRAALDNLFTRGLHGEPQKNTEIGSVPSSWAVEPIGAHFSVVSGGTPSRGNPAYWTGGSIPWVKTTEVDYCEITETEEHITPEGLKNSAAKMLPKETLLMAMYGQGVTRGKVAILGIEAACNQACAAMLPIDDVVRTRYLYHFLTWRYEEIRQLAHGGQQQNLNLEIVRGLVVAIPPIPAEQDEIVTILDAIDRKIDLHRRKRQVLEELFKALLHKLLIGEISVSDLDMSELSSASTPSEEVAA